MTKIASRTLAAGLAVSLALSIAHAQAEDAQQKGVAAIAEKLRGVAIADGERVVLAVGGEGRPTVVSRGAADALPAPANDTHVETVFQARVPANTAPLDELVASFRSFGARGAALRVENGFAHPIIYDADIITRRGENLVISRTSICPVGPKAVGLESWSGPVTGVIVSNPREPGGDDLHCSGDSGLVAAPSITPNVCIGGDRDAPLQVRLYVDPATGERLNAEAAWTLRDPAGGEFAPSLLLVFPMQKALVADRPTLSVVLALVSETTPPAAKTVSIVLVADGREAARRPWQLYAQERAKPSSPPAGAKPTAFFGSVPFPLRAQDGSPDPQLASLYAAIGDGRVKQLEVRIEGDDGTLIAHATFSLSSPAVRNGDMLAAALHDAEARSVAPGHCSKPAK